MLVAVAAVAAVVAAIAAGSRDAGPATRSGAPTWAQVAPIFANKCAGCHTPGGIAPFSLRNAKTAAAYADRILTMTQLGKMPPWMPGHDSPAYLGQSQRLLTPGEKQLIARWVHGGAQIGKGGSVKPVGGGSKAPGTTMTLAPARAYLPKRAVGGLDDYHCFVLEPHLAQDAYVTSAVIKPQRSTIVHHVILFEASGAERRRRTAAQHRLGWQRLDLLRRPGPVGDASDFRFSLERPAGRTALDQRLGARATRQRHAGRNRCARSCGRRDRDAGALQPHSQGAAGPLARDHPLRARPRRSSRLSRRSSFPRRSSSRVPAACIRRSARARSRSKRRSRSTATTPR